MPLQATSGAASYDAFGGGVPSEPNYIESVFSCFLYTGNGSTQTITNGIDLSTKGGLVWIKGRNNSWSHILQDTNRGVNSSLTTNNTEKAVDSTGIYVTSFNSNGFSIGPNGPVNFNTNTYVSWAFRKQPKFYTQGTYTGTGLVQNISHDLGSVPAFIIVKDTTNNGSAWAIYHTSLGNTKYLQFTTDAAGTSSGYWNNTSPTSTQFTVGTNGNVNQSGATYVAYLFAHDAGGFGLTGTDNVISCGSYTGTGAAGNAVTLGYEPQWLLIKRSSVSGNDWWMLDNMRGLTMGIDADLRANLSQAEENAVNYVDPSATGFSVQTTNAALNTSGSTYIYIAIRRGPMKVPTSGTSVFAPVVYAGNGTSQTITTGFANDMEIIRRRGSAENNVIEDKLRGSRVLFTNTTDSELTSTGDVTGYTNTGFTLGASNQGSTNDGGSPSYISWNWRRAPSFMDIVCYTGTGVARTINHNLTTVPQMMIVKLRTGGGGGENWNVYHVSLGNTSRMMLDNTNAVQSGLSVVWNSTTPTSSVFSVGTNNQVNTNGATFVAYLFSTCAGVSKVGSYTGTGALQTVNCGFTSGARFVLIKRTDTTGDWWTYDSARGISSGNDPYLFLNSIAAEGTGTNYVDTDTTGFKVTAAAPAGLNASGGTYIFLAIA